MKKLIIFLTITYLVNSCQSPIDCCKCPDDRRQQINKNIKFRSEGDFAVIFIGIDQFPLSVQYPFRLVDGKDTIYYPTKSSFSSIDQDTFTFFYNNIIISRRHVDTISIKMGKNPSTNERFIKMDTHDGWSCFGDFTITQAASVQ